MTLLPTPLEEAAKAMKERRRSDIEGRTERATYEEQATAAITAYLAQAGKEGWVMVPKVANDQMAVAGGIDCEEVIFGGAGNYPTIFDAMKKVYGTMIANRPLAAAQNGGE